MKKQIQKLLSAMLALTISAGCVPVMVANAAEGAHKTLAIHNSVNEIDEFDAIAEIKETATGIGGKSDSDVSAKVTGEGNSLLNVSVLNSSKTVAKALTFDVYPTSKQTSVSVVGRSSAGWHWSTLNISTEHMNKNAWNSVVVFIDGPTLLRVYVNGKFVVHREEKKITTFNNISWFNIRLGGYYASDAAAEEEYMYMDNIKVLSNQPDMPSVSSRTYTVNGDSVYDLNGATVSDLLNNTTYYGTSVQVLDANGNDITASGETAITDNMQMVVKNGDIFTQKYILKTSAFVEEILSKSTNGTNEKNVPLPKGEATATAVGGIGGKASDDMAVQVTTTSTEGIIFFLDSSVYKMEQGLTQISYDVFADKGVGYIKHGKNSSQSIGLNVQVSDMKAGEWNNIKIVYDPTGAENTILLLNDKLYAQSTTKISQDNHQNTFRICINRPSGTTTGDFNVYVDNIIAKNINVKDIPQIKEEKLLVTYDSNFDGVSAGDTTNESISGSLGKAENDNFLKATNTKADAFVVPTCKTVNWNKSLTILYDVYPTDSSLKFAVRTSYHMSLAEFTTDELNMNSWNRIVAVYDESTKTTAFYLNGKYHSEKVFDLSANQAVRLVSSGQAESVTYYDNIQFVQDTVVPAGMPEGVISRKGEIKGYTGTAGDITNQYESAKILKPDGTVVTADATPEVGDSLYVYNDDILTDHYFFGEKLLSVTIDTDFSSIINADAINVKTVSGDLGKGDNDNYLEVVSTIDVGYVCPPVTGIDWTKPLTILYDVYPTASQVDFAVRTSYHQVLAEFTADELNMNSWNRIVMTYDPSATNSTFWLNGEYHSEKIFNITGNQAIRLITVDANVPTYYDNIQLVQETLSPAGLPEDVVSQKGKIHGYTGTADAITSQYENAKILTPDGTVVSGDATPAVGDSLYVYKNEILTDHYWFAEELLVVENLTNAAENINSGITADKIYVKADTTLDELGTWSCDNFASARVKDSEGNEITDSNAYIVNAVLEITLSKDGRTEVIDIPFADEETKRNMLWKMVLDADNIPAEGSNPTGLGIGDLVKDDVTYSTVTYPSGVGGRSSDDYSVKFTTKHENTPANYAPFFNIQPSSMETISAQNIVYMGWSMLIDDPNNQSRYRMMWRDTNNTWYTPFEIKGGSLIADTDADMLTKVADIPDNEWVRLDIAYNPASNTYTLWVNGVEKASGKTALANNFYRWKMDNFVGAGNIDCTMYYDDFEIYTGTQRDIVNANELITSSSDASKVTYSSANSEIFVHESMPAAEMSGYLQHDKRVNVSVYTDLSCTQKVSGNVSKGNVAVVSDGITHKYYTVYTKQNGYELNGLSLKSNGSATENTFAIGTLSADAQFTVYGDELPVWVILAQYGDNGLISIDVAEPDEIAEADNFKGITVNATAKLSIASDENTTVKAMIWNSGTMQSITEATELFPASKTEITSVTKRFPGFTDKATIFSFDDGQSADAELVELFNAYDVTGTFNLISNKGMLKDQSEENLAYLKELYKGHEVANHVKNHPHLDLPQYASQIDNKVTTADKYTALIDAGISELEAIFGTEVRGMAWPFNNPIINKPGDAEAQAISDYVAKNDYIEYARITDESSSFDLPDNVKHWSFTSHYSEIGSFADSFLNDTDEDLELYSIWGHSYEFASTAPISVIEDYLKKVTAKNIWTPSCLDAAKYIKALDAMTVNGDNIVNNSDVDLYLIVNFKPVIIKANSTYYLYSEDLNAYPTLYLAGDSTCEYVPDAEAPRKGWGMYLGEFLNTNIEVSNHAIRSRSTKTFMSEGRLDDIISQAKQGDYMFIQFGHNDSMTGNDRATTVEEYTQNLTTFVTRAENAGMIPVFITSVRSCTFDSNGKIADDNVDKYRTAMINLGKELNVPVLDLGAVQRAYLDLIGEAEAQKLFLVNGVTEGYTGTDDLVHSSAQGAQKIAELIAGLIKNSNDIGILSYYTAK